MLKRSQRIQRADFATFFKQGRRFHSDHATVVFTPYPTFHASVVVSKKVSKSAVTRNTFRRRVYAKLAAQSTQKQTGVFVVVLKPSFATLTKKESHEEISRLIVKITKSA
jgi:ribonuclease P protein component